VFTYSERPGTPAAESSEQVPIPVRKQRTHVLRDLAAKKNFEFRNSMVGRSLSVVTLEGGSIGLASNYVKVTLARRREANRLEEVRIGGLTADGLSEVGVLPVIC
jgi:threonylcarbamoyladenosine tRNA methylthiotransferase MtaB